MKVSVCSSRPILSPCGLKDIEYQVDPYIGCEHLCYYCYALPESETDWSKEILVYDDIVEQLSRELEAIPPQKIYMGYQTDPYQPCELEYRQTRKVLELFVKNGFSASILTKSDLVLRDIDILKEMEDAAISVSVAFLDNQIRSLLEANTIDTMKRIEALNELKEAGIVTGALLCPVIPYITDVIELVDLLESCTDEIWIYGLSINDRTDQNWLNLREKLRNRPNNLLERIEPIIFSKDHEYWSELRRNLEMLKKDRKLKVNIHI